MFDGVWWTSVFFRRDVVWWQALISWCYEGVSFGNQPRLLLSNRSPFKMGLKVWDRFYAPSSLCWLSRCWSLSLLSNAKKKKKKKAFSFCSRWRWLFLPFFFLYFFQPQLLPQLFIGGSVHMPWNGDWWLNLKRRWPIALKNLGTLDSKFTQHSSGWIVALILIGFRPSTCSGSLMWKYKTNSDDVLVWLTIQHIKEWDRLTQSN